MRVVFETSVLILYVSGLVISEATCPTGWFGSQCQFLCHCDENVPCDINGQCPTNCYKGWFGQSCQYQDLLTISGTTITTNPSIPSTDWLTDRDEETCNCDYNLVSITVHWDQDYPVNWFRLQVKNADKQFSLNLTFTTPNNQLVTCKNHEIYVVDNVTIDYGCDVNDTVQEVAVTGFGVKLLCSMYINGGRNVALHQRTEQTGEYRENNSTFHSLLAVDGNTNSHFLEGSCSHTMNNSSEKNVTPFWALFFDTPKVISRFVIYNRADCCSERLQNFVMETLDSATNTVWRYQDHNNTFLIYYVTTPVRNPVNGVKITATLRLTYDVIPMLNLCEVQVFGDCAPGTWGLDCTKNCPDKCKSSCHPETGFCFDCQGYEDPPACTKECSQGRWGPNCRYLCDVRCYDGSCDKFTGLCDKGCNGFSDPPQCYTECSPGLWGQDCKYNCRTNCYNNTCNKLNGLCDSGCSGHMDPPHCVIECEMTKWGRNCSNSCSRKCLEQKCNRVTGLCDQTCDSNSNLYCPSDCRFGFYGNNCSLECSSTCKDLLCSNHGYCIECLPNYQGHFCEIVTMKVIESSALTFESCIGVVVGVTTAVVLIISVLIVIVVCRMRNRSAAPRDDRNHGNNQGIRHFQSYDIARANSVYQHSYDNVRPIDSASAKDSKTFQATVQFQTSVYETIGETNKDVY